MQKVIIDTDPGTDDALALMMALSSPELEVLGLTTVGGNASLAHTTRNALRLLEYLGRTDIQVYRGAARPLRGRFHYGYYFHGPGGLTVRLPLPSSRPSLVRAWDRIVDQARAFPGEIVLIALGPLTNVARALAHDPGAKDRIKEIVVMGGALEVPGNVTPHAEFNTYNDPAAADAVFSSGIPVTLVGLDVTDRVYVRRDEADWVQGRSRSARLAGRILANWFRAHPEEESYNLCDPLAIVAALRPEILSYRRATVTVETESSERTGKTSATYGAGNVNATATVDSGAVRQFIRRLLGGDGL